MTFIRTAVQGMLRKLGYELKPVERVGEDAEFSTLHAKVKAYTMTSRERQHALYDAVRHIAKAGIPGDIVECGVWRGGSSMIAAEALMKEGDTARTLYLYDTFAGMSEPTEKDVNLHGRDARSRWTGLQKADFNEWDYAPIEDVEANMRATGYPMEQVRLVKGKVEETIPGTVPERIALLRLDTDWYESTKHELVHLFPRLSDGGILILDDYGHWQGARQAVDEYFAEHGVCMHLIRIDYTGRIGVKGATRA